MASTEPAAQTASTPDASARMEVRDLTAGFNGVPAIHEISLDVMDRQVLALIGPSGCGKSTFLRCLNRMLETVPGTWISGAVRLDGRDIYEPGVDAVMVRRHVGMVLQRAAPFPTLSIRANVAAGLKVLGRSARRRPQEVVELALRRAALWDEVKDRLDESALALSGGQQQRLCIARVLAMEPEVLLLDEPTASLDPMSTQKVEDLVYQLSQDITIVFVTHNMQQAARVSDRTAFLLNGELVEAGPTERIFTNPAEPRTEAYVTGRFG